MLDASTIQIQSLKSGYWQNVPCDVLRLDQLHPVVSGNKWFKLRYYLDEAKALSKGTTATFGGAYSNHIVATAFACKEAGVKSIGIIRGEKPPHLSASLEEALHYGMELLFVTREAYRNKAHIIHQYKNEHWYWIPEGGYGNKGMLGAAGILRLADTSSYTHIICACGTGTTLAGLTAAALPQQGCIGISVLKGHKDLAKDVMELVPQQHQGKSIKFFHDYHFGGYAKHPAGLIEWMNAVWRAEQLPTDIVYTSKLMFAVKDLITKNYFKKSDKLLIVHSGGLQGNRGLPKGTLEFL
jgi:1-aminocyclopropane-1-carboxylate deaminase